MSSAGSTLDLQPAGGDEPVARLAAVRGAARRRLLADRERLAGLAASRREQRVVDLLQRVDRTLAAIEVGSWGTCEVCKEPISAERMAGDPFARVCLECLSVDERRALEHDLTAAGKVQRALLPRALDDGGWEASWLWQPRGAVSGDHLDVVPPSCPGEPRHLLLGDVAGKGVAAALLQTHLHALFRALLPGGEPLEMALARANRLFAEATTHSAYATLLALGLHGGGTAELVNAGHPRPLLADHRGVRPIEGADLPLGLFAGASFTRRELEVRPGETLLLYTDGLTEAERYGEEYGIGRAAAALRRYRQAPLDELLAGCRDDLASFLGGAPVGDDLTLVAVRRR